MFFVFRLILYMNLLKKKIQNKYIFNTSKYFVFLITVEESENKMEA